MTEGLVDVGTAELWVETFGESDRPPILLIAGTASSMLSWNDEFCQRLADAGRYVIRYDQRDTGRSTSDPPGHPTYSMGDLIAETVALLDALDLPRAHVFGMSMGAGIAQLVALDHPDRVESLILTACTPGGPGPYYPDLAPPTPALMDTVTGAQADPDWTDRDAVVSYIVESERPYAGSAGFDEAGWIRIAERSFDRAVSIGSLGNHFLMKDDVPPWRQRLGELQAPVLVLQGADESFFPGHGEVLAREVPDSEVIILDGVGHETPPRHVWDQVVSEIVRFTGTERPVPPNPVAPG